MARVLGHGQEQGWGGEAPAPASGQTNKFSGISIVGLGSEV